MIVAILCEGQVWCVGVNEVTSIVGFPEKKSGNCGCLRWLEIRKGEKVLARVNPEYTPYILYE